MKKKYVLRKEVKNLLNKTLLTIIIFLIGMILVKENPNLKSVLNKTIYEDSFKFIKNKKIYEKYFGNILSSNKLTKKEERVSSFTLNYKSKVKYKDGVKLKVDKNYLVPVIESGVIIYMNNKTIVVEQTNGVELTYESIINSNYKLYDYVEKGEILGQVDKNNLYLKFKKGGKYLDYKEYI